MIKIKVEKMYGLNKKKGFEFNSEKKHNFVYAINASGKSSIAMAITHLIDKTKYEKRLDIDNDNFLVKLKFDDIDVTYNPSIDVKDLTDINRRVFVFNKRFIINSLSNPVEGSGITPEIGIRVAEKNAKILENEKIVEENSKQLKKKITDNKLPTTQGNLYEKSLFKFIYGKTINGKIDVLKNLFRKNGVKIQELKKDDFYNENIGIFNSFSSYLSELNKEIIEKLLQSSEKLKYKIDNKEARNFYNEVIKYLDTKDGEINCPLCLSNVINVSQVKDEINIALREMEDNKTMQKILDCFKKSQKLDSLFSNLIEEIYTKLVEYNYPEDEIKSFNEKLKTFLDNYDFNIISYCNLVINTKDISTIEDNCKIIEEIKEVNKHILNSDFIKTFDNMLKYVFKDDEIRAESNLIDDVISIQLYFDGIEKKGKSIPEFYEIISESQRTKLSLAFFLALIIYKNENNKILCIFDDPIDSYDSMSKYNITRILFEFITKKSEFESYSYDCYDIFLSHSIDFFRLFKSNLLSDDIKNTNFYTYSSKVRNIDSNDYFLVEGDYIILSEFLKNNNKIEEYLSIMPILRELTKISSINFQTNDNKLSVGDVEIKEIHDFITQKVIHGFDVDLKLKDLYDELEQVIKNNIPANPLGFGITTNDNVFDAIEKIIDGNRMSILHASLSFREEIVLKNLLALYIRSFYDSVLANLLKLLVPSYSALSIEEINQKVHTCGGKILKLKNSRACIGKTKKICQKISANLAMLNDFEHISGIYLTPLIDVELSDLYALYDEIRDKKSILGSIITKSSDELLSV